MPVFEFGATIAAHGVHRWWTGGGDYYASNHFPQFDVRIPPTPAVFPDDSGHSPALVYKDFACAVNDIWPYHASYFLTVENPSDIPIGYRMRVWVP